MFVEPDAAESKAAAKADPTAPARSAIRRQRTVRYSPNARGHQPVSSASNPRRLRSSHGRLRISGDRRPLLEDIHLRDRDTGHTSVETMINEITDLETALQGNSYMSEEADLAHTEASQRSRLDSGRALLRDALSYERSGERMRIPREAMVVEVPEVTNHLRTYRASEIGELRSSSQLDEARSPIPGYMPTPPHTSGDYSDSSPPQSSRPTLGTALLTTRFAPAHRLHNETEGHDLLEGLSTREQSLGLLADRLPPLRDALRDENDQASVTSLVAEIDRMRHRVPADLSPEYLVREAEYLRMVGTRVNLLAGSGVHETGDTDLLEGLQPLRRMSGHNYAQLNARSSRGQEQNNLDGLGDRQRSFSPEDDAWETLLTTIPPDERIPSTFSSSTSASASASSLSANSASSYGTLVTAPSTSTELEACPADLSDFDEDYTPEGSDEESFELRTRSTRDMLRRSDDHLSRIESLSRRLTQHRSRSEQISRRQRRLLERDEELRRLEGSLQRLERQIAEERGSAAGRHRPDGVRRVQERL